MNSRQARKDEQLKTGMTEIYSQLMVITNETQIHTIKTITGEEVQLNTRHGRQLTM